MSVFVLTIGFFMLVLGISLMKIRGGMLRSGGTASNPSNGKALSKEGLFLILLGLLVVVASIFPQLQNEGHGVLKGAGVSLISLGFSSLFQWAVVTGRSTVRDLYVGAWVSASIGAVLIIAVYPILIWVFHI